MHVQHVRSQSSSSLIVSDSPIIDFSSMLLATLAFLATVVLIIVGCAACGCSKGKRKRKANQEEDPATGSGTGSILDLDADPRLKTLDLPTKRNAEVKNDAKVQLQYVNVPLDQLKFWDGTSPKFNYIEVKGGSGANIEQREVPLAPQKASPGPFGVALSGPKTTASLSKKSQVEAPKGLHHTPKDLVGPEEPLPPKPIAAV